LFSIPSVLKPTFQPAWKTQSGKVILLCLLLFGLVFWTFLPSLHGNFIDIDDGVFVIRNPHINLTLANVVWAFGHAECANWLPLTLWSFMLDHQIYGLKPWGYHLTNVSLHAFNTVLVFLVLRRMMGLRSDKSIGATALQAGATWRSLMVAGLFGLHPLRVESVAWISERKDVLSMTFWMLTLWAYVRYVEKSKVQSPKSKVFYGLTLLFFALSLMSKPMVVTLPCVLLLLDYWPLERWQRKNLRGLLVEKAPFFLLSAIVSVVTYVAQRNAGMLGASLTGLSLSFGARLENALVSYARYLGKLFWPADLCALYPYPDRWPTHKLLLAGLLVLGLSILVFTMRRHRPFLLTGWLWYLGTLVPVIGLVSVGAQAMADRYSYIPSIGILMVLVWGAYQMTKQWHHQDVILGTTGGALVLACIVLTRHQIGCWKDEVSLWRRAVAVTENNYEAHNRLGRALSSQKRYAEAVREFQEAARLNPGLAEVYYSLGHISSSLGRVAEAVVYYQRALAVRPDYVAVHDSLGDLLRQEGRLDEAIDHFRKAVEIQPDSAISQNNLGFALSLKGRPDEALAHFQKAVDLDSNNQIIQYNFGSFLLQRGRVDEAIGHFRSALKLQPDNAEIHNDLGHALLLKEQPDEAIRELQTAARLKPDQAEAHSDLGRALLNQGRFDEAIREFQAVVRLNPDQAEAHANLGYAFVKQGGFDEAICEFQVAAKLKPDKAEAHTYLGYALTKQGRLDEAIREYQEAVKLKPDDLEVSNDLVIAVGMKAKQPQPPIHSTKP
jgi:tetratricopeptide (TPR) repeat protein